ncbi:MAG TPA: HAMP domain-containing sensor histidine kinase [bacterium]|nr:HAMP domain-containing sensor histidine kinase [bacterium]HPN42463.1 HAMP domain-containing sensor histidine kinase [bacterium]
MKKQRSLFYPIFIFVLAQVAWIVIVLLWIFRYVASNIIYNHVGERITPQLVSKSANVLELVGGLVLMVTASVGLLLIFRNLTDQMKITGMYDNFIANITHELKSPLSSIQLYLETLKSRQVPPAKQTEFLNRMLKDADRLKNLINSILEISGLEQKKIVFNYEIVAAGPTFRKLLQDTAGQFNLSSQEVIISGDAPCSCVIDRNAMRTVLDNLVDNAIKYSEGPPQIEMKFANKAGHLVLEFRDHGIGIAKKDQKQVFQKFHRIYRPDIPNVKGTGLGLYWVKEIIKMHGGKIHVHSEGAGQGTAFTIDLPVYPTAKTRYINNLLKLTQKRKKIERGENEPE